MRETIPEDLKNQYELNEKWLALPTPQKPHSTNSVEAILRSDWNSMAERTSKAEARNKVLEEALREILESVNGRKMGSDVRHIARAALREDR